MYKRSDFTKPAYKTAEKKINGAGKILPLPIDNIKST